MNFKLSTPERPQWMVRSICHESKIFVQARAALTFCTQQGSETYTPPLFHTHENKTILNLRGHMHLPAGKMAQEYYFAIGVGTSHSEFLALGPRTALKKNGTAPNGRPQLLQTRFRCFPPKLLVVKAFNKPIPQTPRELVLP